VAITYALDLYPAENPRDGERLRRFSQLQQVEIRAVRNGTGSGFISLRGNSVDAGFIDPDGNQYIRVVRIDTAIVDAGTTSGFDELVVWGFFLEEGDFEALSANSTKLLTFSGGGPMAYFAREFMWSHAYLDISGFGDQDPFDDTWRLYAAGTGDELGAILWRVITECQGFRVGTTPYTHRHGDGVTYTDIHDDDRLATAIPQAVIDFTADLDSSGNAWTVTSGDFTAAVGESPLSIIGRLIEAGLYIEMDPDTFELRAWEAANHGRDRTGTAWGASVIRFQKPTDPNDPLSGNIKSDAKRAIFARDGASQVLVGGNDIYGDAEAVTTVTLTTSAAADDIIDTTTAHGFQTDYKVEFTTLTGGAGLSTGTTYYVVAVPTATSLQVSATRGGAAINFTTDITAGSMRRVMVPWHHFYPSKAADVTALDAVAAIQVTERTNSGNVARLRTRLGKTPATDGSGRPFEEILLDDLATIHTGAGQWDWNEAALPVAALALQMRRGKKGGQVAWNFFVDLGSVYTSTARRAITDQIKAIVKQPGSHTHPPNPSLCDPAIACEALTPAELTAGTATNGDAEDTGGGQWSGGVYTTTHKHGGARSYGDLDSADSTFVYTWDPAQVFTRGTRYVVDIWGRNGGVGDRIDMSFGVEGTDEEHSLDAAVLESGTGADGNPWNKRRICWTPTEDRTGVRLSYRHTLSALAFMVVDDLSLSTTTNNELAGTSPKAARCDHGHRAQDIPLRTPPGMVANDVQAGFDELAAKHPEPVTAALSNPPTEAELVAALGAAADHEGVHYLLTDSDTRRQYLALSDGLRYVVVPLLGNPASTAVQTITTAPAGGWGDLSTAQQVAQYYDGKTFFAYTKGTSGDVCAASYDHATGAVVETVLRAALTTDVAHGSPVVLLRESDKRVLVAYTSQANAALYLRISASPADVSLFESEVNLDTQIGGTLYTYPQILQLLGEANDPIYIFIETNVTGTTQTWGYTRSTDGGMTWSAIVDFFNQPAAFGYVSVTKTSESRVDVLATDGALSATAPISPYHCYFSGGSFFKTDGTAIVAALPFSTAAMTQVYDASVENVTSQIKQVVLGSDGHPRALFHTYHGTTDHRWRWGRWTGTAWTTTEVCDSGWDSDDGRSTVSAGACLLPDNPNVIYASRSPSGGTNQIFRYTTPDDGVTFREEQLTTGTPGKVRPLPVVNAASDLAVLYLEGTSDPPPGFSAGVRGLAAQGPDHLTRLVSIAGTKAEVETLAGARTEIVVAVAEDTDEIGVYANGVWTWVAASNTHWEPVVFDNAGTPEIVYFQDASGVWDIVMAEVAN